MEINDIYLIVSNKGFMYICDTVVSTEFTAFNTDQVNTLYNVSNKGFGVSTELAIFNAEHRRQGVKCLLTIQCI